MKYRVFDDSLHRYLDPSEVLLMPNGWVRMWQESGVWEDIDPATTEWLIVEQFTGLLDTDGTEIYQGDVTTAGSGIRGVLVVGWYKEHASFCLDKQGWMYSHYFGEAIDPQDCKVLGNVHENKELVKGD